MGAEPRAIQLTSAPFSCYSCCEFISLIRLAIYEANKAPFVCRHVGKEIPDQVRLEGRGAHEKLSRTGSLCRYYQAYQNERDNWGQGTGLKSPWLKGYVQIYLGKPNSSLLARETHIVGVPIIYSLSKHFKLYISWGFCSSPTPIGKAARCSRHLRPFFHHLIYVFPWPLYTPFVARPKQGSFSVSLDRTGSPSTLVTLAYTFLEYFFSEHKWPEKHRLSQWSTRVQVIRYQTGNTGTVRIPEPICIFQRCFCTSFTFSFSFLVLWVIWAQIPLSLSSLFDFQWYPWVLHFILHHFLTFLCL